MTFTVEYEREDDGRWLAEVVELPGVLAYGEDSDEAIAKAQALALRVLADRLVYGEGKPELSASPSPLHEPLVFSQGEARSRGAYALAGKSNENLVLTRFFLDQVGLMSFLLFTTGMKLARRCWRGLPKILVSSQTIYKYLRPDSINSSPGRSLVGVGLGQV